MGNELFKKVTKSTGLPEDIMAGELDRILSSNGINSSEVTLDELRAVLSDYLKEVIIKAKDEFDQGVLIEEEVNPEDLGL